MVLFHRSKLFFCINRVAKKVNGLFQKHLLIFLILVQSAALNKNERVKMRTLSAETLKVVDNLKLENLLCVAVQTIFPSISHKTLHLVHYAVPDYALTLQI